MFQSWVTRQVRQSAAHPVSKRPRRIPLSLELCEDRLPPGQILSFLVDPLADVFGPTPVEQPAQAVTAPALTEAIGGHGGQLDTSAALEGLNFRSVTNQYATASVVPSSPTTRPGGATDWTNLDLGVSLAADLLQPSFATQRAPVLEATNAIPALPSNVFLGSGSVTTPGRWGNNNFRSIQVNVNAQGNNIVGDAANEPSMAIDPTDPNRIVIGWRQFDWVLSSFRQAGWGYSHDAGTSWTFPGKIQPGIFRSDPVLDVDADGNFYYNSLATNPYITTVFKSTDSGLSWDYGTFAFGGDKQWMTIDRSDGPGRGNIYATWNRQFTTYGGDFTRSTDGGASFTQPINLPGNPFWGTLSVGPDSELYISGRTQAGFRVVRSTNAHDSNVTPTFAFTPVNLGGTPVTFGEPNPDGLLGQAWVATDHSSGSSRGNVYILSPVNPPGPDPLDVMMARSTDGGVTFGAPVRVNDGPAVAGSWQWMATMSVAPNGRIDATWYDTRGSLQPNLSQLYYAYSVDAGATWSRSTAVSPVFDSHVGWPQQNKLGDYTQSISDDTGVSVAYAATFNNEQDVYFLRINVEQVPHVIPAPPIVRL